jgi:hypothetical protein
VKTLHPDARDLLARIVRAIEGLRKVDGPDLIGCEWRGAMAEVQDARNGMIAIDFDAWYERALSGAERRRALRLLDKLAEAGKLYKRADNKAGVRSTHVELPPGAFRKAKR